LGIGGTALIASLLVGMNLFSTSLEDVKNIENTVERYERLVELTQDLAEPEVVEEPEPKANWISRINLNYNKASDRISFSFALSDSDQNYIAKSGTAEIRFIDDSEKTVDTVTVNFEKEDFVKLKSPLVGTYLAYHGFIPQGKLLDTKEFALDAFVKVTLTDRTVFNVESILFLD